MLNKKMTYPKVQRISREKIECDLTFLGFVILENRLKPDTCDIINDLMAAHIRTIMVTGDNILTALSVAHDCDMIPTGQSVIIVTAKPKQIFSNEYELIYNLTGTSPNNNRLNNQLDVVDNLNAKIPNNNATLPISLSAANLQQLHHDQQHVKSKTQKPNGFILNERTGNGNSTTNTNENGITDYCSMTNSNSIASLETVDTCTQTTLITQRDIEIGAITKSNNQYNSYDDDDDDNNLLVSIYLLFGFCCCCCCCYWFCYF